MGGTGAPGLTLLFTLSEAKGVSLKDDPENPRSYEDGSIPPLTCIYILAHLWGSNKIMDVKKEFNTFQI